jgi:hypothetical protein
MNVCLCVGYGLEHHLRIPVLKDGSPGPLGLVADNLGADDFAFGTSGACIFHASGEYCPEARTGRHAHYHCRPGRRMESLLPFLLHVDDPSFSEAATTIHLL